MGAFQRNLYETAAASALKSELAEWLAVSHSLDSTVERLRKRYEVGFVAVSAEGANFWIALADQLHQFGMDHEATFRIARKLIDEGEAVRLLRETGAPEEDIRARARTLRRLRDKWETPAKRTRKIPALKPEPFVMHAGEVYAYDTLGGNPNHPSPGVNGRPARFKPDARNAFVVFNTARVFFDTEARYFIVPLALFKRDKSVTIEEAARAHLVCHCEIDKQRFSPLGGWMNWDKKVLSAVAPTLIGTVDTNLCALERVFGQSVHAPLSRNDGPDYPLWMNYGILSNVVRAHIWGGPDDRLEAFVKAWKSA